jgi:hypothetical protein
MFEQRDRWLEELREFTERKESLTCASGQMPLTAIAQEIVTACADTRQHRRQQVPNWQSMASDLADALDWIGSDLQALVGSAGRAIHRNIMNDLLVTGPGGGTNIDDSKRSVVAARATALIAVLDRDDVLIAAWRDLVVACRDIDHNRYPSERVALLRDTLIGLSEHRNQDRGHWSPISTAVQVLFGNPSSARQAQAMVGDQVDGPHDPDAVLTLTEQELADLAERCLVNQPLTGNYVIWFRISPAFVLGSRCATHGDVTFYDAQSLAGALTNHKVARELDVPEELLTEQIRDLQLSPDVDDRRGFEFEPQLVYARVSISDVERHRAIDAARTILDTVLAVVGVADGMWEVLDGALFFDDNEKTHFAANARWGLKKPLPEPVFYQNDHFVRDLSDMTANGHVITAEIAQQLQPALRLFTTLANTPRSDAEAVVMAAVRGIEHCNAWTAPLGDLHWNKFIDEYLLDEYTVSAFSKRVVLDVFAGVEQYLPDRTPGALPPAELEAMRQDITVSGLGTTIDRTRTTAHVAALRRIYADHWLVRRLAETDDILSSPAALAAAFDVERDRVSNRVKRLTRSRNAAIHGGPLSDAAFDTIAEIAAALGRQALSTTITATVAGQSVEARATSRRDEFRQRITNLRQGGDLANLFKLTP